MGWELILHLKYSLQKMTTQQSEAYDSVAWEPLMNKALREQPAADKYCRQSCMTNANLASHQYMPQYDPL